MAAPFTVTGIARSGDAGAAHRLPHCPFTSSYGTPDELSGRRQRDRPSRTYIWAYFHPGPHSAFLLAQSSAHVSLVVADANATRTRCTARGDVARDREVCGGSRRH